jgi:hypothetical protein
MKLQSFLCFALMLAFAGFSSCKKTQITDNINSTFDENIKIRMIENVDSVKRTLILNCATEKIFECSNYGIQTSFSVTSDKIIINFIQLQKPDICLTSLGPALAVINLGELANKNYELELNFASEKITGQLQVTTASFTATLTSQTKVQFLNPNLNRVPANTIYGTVHYHANSTNSIVQKFIDSLQYLGAKSTSYLPGDYNQFQIESNGQIKQTQDLGYYFTRYFIYNYTSNSAQLKNLVRRFGVNYPDSLLITLHTTRGETFYSWIP